MITAITIENFKGISEPVRVELKPITLLFGPNSAGKSTIIQALQYVREILAGDNVDADTISVADEGFNLGGFSNLVHKHDLKRSIRIKVEICGDTDWLPAYKNSPVPDDLKMWQQDPETKEWSLTDGLLQDEISTAWVELEVQWSSILERPLLCSYSTGINDILFATITCAEDGKGVKISDINFDHPSLVYAAADDEENYPGTSLYNRLADKNSILTPEQAGKSVFKDLFEQHINPLEFRDGRNINLYLHGEDIKVRPEWGKSLMLDHKLDVERFPDKSINRNYKFWAATQRLNGYLSQLIVGPGEALLKELHKSVYVGPIRKIPPRNFIHQRSGDNARWSSGLAAWDYLFTTTTPQEFINRVNDWIASENGLDCGYSVNRKLFKELTWDKDFSSLFSGELQGDVCAKLKDILQNVPVNSRMSLTDKKRDVEIQPHDIGIGISQLIPVVVAALDDNQRIVSIEQPELHTHPKLQVSMGDLFISQIKMRDDNSNLKLFILETHSEHLLLRLLRRIRETYERELPEDKGLTPEEVSINYIEMDRDRLSVRKLEITPDGDSFGPWPKGFFEERAGELF